MGSAYYCGTFKTKQKTFSSQIAFGEIHLNRWNFAHFAYGNLFLTSLSIGSGSFVNHFHSRAQRFLGVLGQQPTRGAVSRSNSACWRLHHNSQTRHFYLWKLAATRNRGSRQNRICLLLCFATSKIETHSGDAAACDISDWRPLLSEEEANNLKKYEEKLLGLSACFHSFSICLYILVHFDGVKFLIGFWTEYII